MGGKMGEKVFAIKSQIIADTETRLVYDVAESPGSVHDFRLCKETLLIPHDRGQIVDITLQNINTDNDARRRSSKCIPPSSHDGKHS